MSIGISNSLFIISLLFTIYFSLTLGSSVYAQTSPAIITDYNDWYYTDHGALVNVTYDASPNPQPTSISVQAKSNVDNVVCNLTFYQSHNVNTPTNYVFSGSSSYDLPIYVMFTTGSTSNCAIPQLAVSANVPTVTITFNGVSKTILTENSDTPSNWTLKTTDQPYKKVILSCSANDQTSGDGICDSWKDQMAHPGYMQIPYTDPAGFTVTYKWGCNPTTNTALTQNECPTVGHKDIYIETDWFLRHHPDSRMISALKTAFANAPVSNTVGGSGINLHIILDEEIPFHKDQITAPSAGAPLTATSDFDILKTNYFGTVNERNAGGPSICNGAGTDQCVTDILTAKRQVFHYALIAHSQGGGISGASELPGNDMLISLGGFTGGVGSLDQLKGTFMHELGHNLNLYHGGSSPPDPTNPDYDNCKPNYLSVMNYNFQFSDFIYNRALDYSHGTNVAMDKTQLHENWGVYGSVIMQTPPNTVYGIPSSPWFQIAPVGSYWGTYGTDFDGSATANDPLTDVISSNVNNLQVLKSSCNVPNTTTNNPLNDFSDWTNLLFDIKTSSAFYDGTPITAIGGVAVPPPDETGTLPDSHGRVVGVHEITLPLVPAVHTSSSLVEKYNPINFIPNSDASRLASAAGGNLPVLNTLYSVPAGFMQEKGISINETREIRSDRVLSIFLNVTNISPGSTTNTTSKAMALQDITDAYNFTKQDALYSALLKLHDARTELNNSISNVNNTKNNTLALLDNVVKSLEIALAPVQSYPDAPQYRSGHKHGHGSFTTSPYGQLTSGVSLTQITCTAGSNYALLIHTTGSTQLPICIKTSDIPQLMVRSPASWITLQQYHVIMASSHVTVSLNSPNDTGLVVKLDGKATSDSNASIVNISWDWGDGQTSTGSFPQTHTYSKYGTYTITVTATDSNNLTGSASTIIPLLDLSLGSGKGGTTNTMGFTTH